jgi:uncharacterized membrane protein
MDRNLNERLKKLSHALAKARHGGEYTDAELENIDALQDEIWEVEDLIREEFEAEQSEHHSKDWY